MTNHTRGRMNTLKKTMLSLLALAALAVPALADTSGVINVSVSGTPTALKCSGTGQYVNHAAVRVVPGGSGKIYVGNSSMNIATGAGVAQILYPNGGAHSEEFSIDDKTGQDGINLCNLYVAGDVTNETALVDYKYTTGTSGADPLVLVQAKRYSATSTGTKYTFDTTGYVNKVKVQVIPGQTGKIQLTWDNWYGSTYGNFHVLYPNSGTLSQHNAWSESWDRQDPLGENGFYSESGVFNHGFTGWGFMAYVAGEGVQVQQWQKQHAGSVITPAHGRRDLGGQVQGISVTTTPTAVMGNSVEMRMDPGYCAKVFIGDNSMVTSTGVGVYKTLYPNCSGGWSERFNGLGAAKLDVSGVVGLSVERITRSSDFQPLTAGGAVSWTTTPVALGTTSVSKMVVSVTPGQTGKVYIGNSTLDPSTLAGVYAVLYPNSSGAWSEEFELSDPQGDGIDLSTIYVLGAVTGEQVSIGTYTSGTTPATPLTVKLSGPVYNASSTAADLLAGSSTPAAVVRAQVLPGESYKVRVGLASMTGQTQPDSSLVGVAKILWPNTGSYSVGEGHSETFKLACQDGSNCLDASAYAFFTEGAGEHLVLSVWGR